MVELRQRIGKFVALLGKRNLALLSVGIFVGIGWFATETAFVYVLQLFFVALGMISPAQAKIFARFPTGLGFACSVLLVFAFLRFLVTTARGYFAVSTQQGFVFHIRRQLAASALESEVSVSGHDVIGLFSEVTNNGGLLVYNLAVLVVDACATAFFLGAALWIAPIQTLIGVSICLLAIWPLKYGVRKIDQLGQKVQGEWDNANYGLTTAIKNKFLLKLYGTVDLEVSRTDRTLEQYFENQKKYGFWQGLLIASPVLVGACAVVVVSYTSFHYSSIKPINLTAFLYIFMRLAQIGSETNTVFSSVRFYLPSVKALYDWLYRKQSRSASGVEGDQALDRIERISLEKVDFAFGPRSVLSNMSFEVEAGESLVIIGPSGAGKSTLLSVLLGLYPPARGEVLINGFSIARLRPEWRDKVAYVGPDPFIIEGTLRENLLYGNKRKDLTDAQVWSIIESVGLRRELSENVEGLDYYLKSATRFSSGQLQRLSIARALLRDFDILIFDEGTANLDLVTAKLVLSRVREMTKDKIFVRVTHQSVNRDIEKVIELGESQIQGMELSS